MAIVPTREQVEELAGSSSGEPIVMLNLLRFKDQADGIDEGLSGAEAYARYGEGAQPFLERVGGRLLIAVAAQQTFIGPEAGEWDMALMVEYPSRKAFLEMATDPEYLEVHRHRDAALADSRLIVCEQVSLGA
ncbi:MAG TPA: DUF1330 domain-containing protein [Thermoleophilaceae bacterium]